MFQVINVKQNNAGLELKPFSKQGNKDFKKKHTVVTFSPPFFPLMVVCYWVSVDLLSPQREGSSSMTLFTSYTRSSGFILCACTSRMFFYCLKFPIISYNSFLIEPKGGSENRVRERECEKWRLKERNQREKSIDEAISPPPPRVQCISFSPWNTITRREEWEEEEERKVREGRCWRRKKKKMNAREIYFNETVF